MATITCSIIATASFSSLAMDERIETALIDVCKSTLTNSLSKLRHTAKSYNLKENTIALKVMCNGEDIIAFAQAHGSTKVAERLERSISSNVNIIDIANIKKTNVNFTL